MGPGGVERRQEARSHADRIHALEEWRKDAEMKLEEGSRRFGVLADSVQENTAISKRAEENAATAALKSTATASAVRQLDLDLAGAKRFFGWLATGADLYKLAGDVAGTLSKIVLAGGLVWGFFKYVVKLAVLQ